MRYLLDTNVVILSLKGDAATVQLLVTLAQTASEPFSISTVMLMEAWDGVHRAPNPQVVKAQYQAFFDAVTIRPFDIAVAKRCARLRHDLRAQSIRTRDRALDFQIAATALHHGLLLVTYNRQDYDDIHDLTLYL